MDNEMKELFVDLSEKVYSDSYGLLLRQILSARRYEEVIRMGDEKPEPSFSELVNRLARMTYSLKESISQSGSMKIDHDIVRYALLFALLMWCDGEKIFNKWVGFAEQLYWLWAKGKELIFPEGGKGNDINNYIEATCSADTNR